MTTTATTATYEVVPERELHRRNPHARQSDAWFAWNQQRCLERLVVEGLPDVYEGKLASYWYDFYPDFSWDGRMSKQMQIMLSDGGFPALAAAFALRFPCDLVAELQRAMASVEEGAS